MRRPLALLALAAALLAAACATTKRPAPEQAEACTVQMEPEVVNIVCGQPG